MLLNVVPPYGSTPLILATRNKHAEIVKLLIDAGADVNCCDEYKWTALHYAVRDGLLDVVKFILQKKEVCLDATLLDGRTPLMLAVGCEHAEIAKLLIDAGANVNCCDEYNWTALHYAARDGLLDVVQSIVQKKEANLDAALFSGKTPLVLAAWMKHTEIAKLLIEAGANVNCCDEDNWTALHYAARDGLLDVVQSIVQTKEANLDAALSSGDTPLMLAAGRNHTEIAKLLIEAGANVNCCGSDKWTALHYAARDGLLDVVQLILQKKEANLDAPLHDGTTPLQLASLFGKVDIVEHLLIVGSDCNLEDKYGQSTFTEAIEMANIKLIKLCIKNGAYFKRIDYDRILNNSLLKQDILLDSKLCSLAIINKFNQNLSELYNYSTIAQILPCLDMMKIKKSSQAVHSIKQSIENEIKRKGHCNLLDISPPVLSMFSVKSLLDYYKCKNFFYEMKRPASNDACNSNKKLKVKNN